MKKLLAIVLAAVMLLSLAACTGGAKNAALADDTHVLWAVHGQNKLADGTDNGWNGKSNELYEKSALTAISLDDVKAISEDLYTTLSGKEIKYLYTIDLILGVGDAGWAQNFLKDGKLYKANGSYCFKVVQCNADVEGDTKVYSEDQWIPNPHNANVESLTPATAFFPTWQEEKDANGFEWSQNPVAIGGAGLYTLVIAQYTTVSAAGQPGYGIGLVLKEQKDGVAYEEVKTFVPADHTFGVVGSFEASGWEDGKDVAMTADGDNKWTAEVTLVKDNEFKVRADGKWDDSWGPEGHGDSNNFKCEADGTYAITITFDADGNGTVTVTAK